MKTRKGDKTPYKNSEFSFTLCLLSFVWHNHYSIFFGGCKCFFEKVCGLSITKSAYGKTVRAEKHILRLLRHNFRQTIREREKRECVFATINTSPIVCHIQLCRIHIITYFCLIVNNFFQKSLRCSKSTVERTM